MKTTVRCLLSALLLVAAVPRPDAQISLTDGLGRTLRFAAPVSRVVSLSPACTEVLFAIGGGKQVVGVTAYCNYPPEAAAKPKIGGFAGKSVSLETLVSLRPDLVVVEGQMHEQIVAVLDKAKIACYAAEALRLEDAYRVVAQLGTLLGLERNAEAVSSGMRGRIERIARLTAAQVLKDGARPGVFWEVWDDPLMTAGGTSFITEAIEAAGGRNVFADLRSQYPTVSFESVLARDPAWIASGTDHGAKLNASALSRRQGWRSLKAVRENKIALIDADSINRAGPRLADAVEELARRLHPEVFP